MSLTSGKTSKKKSLKAIPSVNNEYENADFKSKLKQAFVSGNSLKHGTENIFHVDPFSLCVLPNFVSPVSFIEHLKEELADQIFYEKNNDLYKFQQTDDLKKISSPYVKAIRKFLYENVRKWLCEVTGLALTEKVDSTCSRYDYTDVLLCHDDELDTRRIAFVLYLVPVWKKEDGGLLDLFDMDEHLQPKNVVKSITPAFNQLLWFEVTEASHHQVSEVLCQCKSRLSINGWFHASPTPRPQRYIEPKLPLHNWSDVEEDTFYEWINPIYLDPEVQGQIQEKFESDSEIELQGFLQEEKYQLVVEALKSTGISWKKITPPNKRQYQSVNAMEESEKSSLPVILQDCLKFLQSEMMFLTLSNLTGLSLHPLAADNSSPSEDEKHSEDVSEDEKVANMEEDCSVNEQTSSDSKCVSCSNSTSSSSNTVKEKRPARKKQKLDHDDVKEQQSTGKSPKCRAELRMWNHGDYTLVHDTDIDGMEFALDAMLYCSCKGWEDTYGGYTSYIAKGEDEELLTVIPTENSLALVYRDKETLHFVKHVNDNITHSTKADHTFYDFNLVYHE